MDHTLTGNIEHHVGFASQILKNKRDIWVYRPPPPESPVQKRVIALGKITPADGGSTNRRLLVSAPSQQGEQDECSDNGDDNGTEATEAV